MSFPFPFSEIDERDHDGLVIARGAKWIEFNVDRFMKALFFTIGAALFSIPFAQEIMRQGVHAKAYNVQGVLMALAVMSIAAWVMLRELRQRRSVVFHVDGTTQTPCGFPGNERETEMLQEHAAITSIEAERIKGDDWAVQVYMRNGEVYTWTRYQSRFDAHKIAVTLTNALRIVREAAARADAVPSAAAIDQRVKAAMRSMKPGDHVRVVID